MAEDEEVIETEGTEDEEDVNEAVAERTEDLAEITEDDEGDVIEDEVLVDEAGYDEEDDEEEEDERKDIENVTKENEELLRELEEGKDLQEKPPESEALKGKIDDETMKELVQIEKEAKEAANVIYEIKLRIEELLKVETMTEDQEKELEDKNIQLKDQMMLFNEKTKRIQEIIASTNILESIPTRLAQEKHEEDVLPRVILCGLDDDYVPKIVVCHQKNKGAGPTSRQCFPTCPGPPPPPPCAPSTDNVTKKTSLNKNEELNQVKLQLEKDISDKNRLLEQLQIKLENLQKDIHDVATENAQLNEKIRRIQKDQTKRSQPPCQPNKVCPSVLAAKLKDYGNYTKKLERTVAEMEEDFDRVHREICAAIKARDEISKKNKMKCSRR